MIRPTMPNDRFWFRQRILSLYLTHLATVAATLPGIPAEISAAYGGSWIRQTAFLYNPEFHALYNEVLPQMESEYDAEYAALGLEPCNLKVFSSQKLFAMLEYA